MVLLFLAVARDKSTDKERFEVSFICALFYIACLKIEWKRLKKEEVTLG